jgi:hypothetical protein
MIATVAVTSFLLATLLTAVSASLYFSQRTRVMKADVKIALHEQAQDSYRAGYMRALIEEYRQQARRQAAYAQRNLTPSNH